MGNLSHDNRLSVRTAPEVLESLNILLARLRSRGHEFRGRKIGLEGLVGAVLLEFLDRPGEAQADVLARRVPELEALIEGRPRPEPPLSRDAARRDSPAESAALEARLAAGRGAGAARKPRRKA